MSFKGMQLTQKRKPKNKIGKKIVKSDFEWGVYHTLKAHLPKGANLEYETEKLRYTIMSFSRFFKNRYRMIKRRNYYSELYVYKGQIKYWWFPVLWIDLFVISQSSIEGAEK